MVSCISSISNVQEVDETIAMAAVKAAFDRGINFFDTSPYYGSTRSETVLGKAIKQLPREEIIVASKVGRYGAEEFDFSAARVIQSVHESLQRLGLKTLDLVQCHDIEFVDLDLVVGEALPALQQLKEDGLVRAIGITGLPLKCLVEVLDRVPSGVVDVVLSYCHYTLCDTTLCEFIPRFREYEVGVINASPLCMGLLTAQGPPAWHPAPRELRDAAAAAADVARSVGASLPRLAIMDSMKNEHVSSLLVGLSSPKEVNENCDAVLHALSLMPNPDAEKEEKALKDIKMLLKPVQGMTWRSGRPENN